MDALPEIARLIYPPGTEILAAQSYRPGYRPFPMQVTTRSPEGRTERHVLKIGDHAAPIEREAKVLRALTVVGLPVPMVLAGPLALAGSSTSRSLLVLSELPGTPLPWLGTTSLADADLTCRLLIRGVGRLHKLTECIRRHEVAPSLPHVTLLSELDEIVQRGGEVTVHGVGIVGPHREPPGYERAESRVFGLPSPPATGGRTRSPCSSPESARVRRRFPRAAVCGRRSSS